jgi:succinate dehydrogenase/fumarate reductase cytochrome b subunit
MYTLQRVTGIIAFLFISFHLWEYWGQKMIGKLQPEDFYPTLCANMSSFVKGVPVVALVYLIGIAAAVFHFANGLWGFCFSWGITVSRRSQRLGAAVFSLVGIAVFLMGANTAIYFATGSRFALFGASGAARTCAGGSSQTGSHEAPVAAP